MNTIITKRNKLNSKLSYIFEHIKKERKLTTMTIKSKAKKAPKSCCGLTH
jgi:hypothetical protein